MFKSVKRLILVGITTSLIFVGSFLVSQFATVANAQSFFGVLSPQITEVTLAISKPSITTAEFAQASAGGGSGDGSVSFTSSTPNKCTVSGTGVITPVAVGSCSLFATRASSGIYLQRSSSVAIIQVTALAAATENTTNGTSTSNRALLVDAPRFDATISESGGKSVLNWSASKRVSIIIKSKNGSSTTSAVALVEKGGTYELPALAPGYLSTVTVIKDDESDRREFSVTTPPTKPNKVSVVAASKATNYAYILKWEPTSYVEYYRITVQQNDGEKITYLSTTPDFYVFDRKAQSYLFTVAALGEGDSASDPISFRATLTAPISLIANFKVNAKTSKFTTVGFNGLHTVATRSDPNATVTVVTYFDSKKKITRLLAKERATRAAALIKAARSTVVVNILLKKASNTAQLSQMQISSKAPVRKLVLSNS